MNVTDFDLKSNNDIIFGGNIKDTKTLTESLFFGYYSQNANLITSLFYIPSSLIGSTRLNSLLYVESTDTLVIGLATEFQIALI